MTDEEDNVVEVQYVSGYPSLASFIAKDFRDHSTAIYRRFDRLSARNLLILQSEVAELEQQQNQLDKEDFEGDDIIIRDSWRDWSKLSGRATKTPPREAEQVRRDLILRIREKLKEYRGYFGRPGEFEAK